MRSMVSHRMLTVLISTLVAAAALADDATRALPAGQPPDDHRLGKLRTLNDDFPFTPVESAGAWKTRAEKLKRQVLLANGIWPLPTKTPLNAVVHGKVEREDFTVERVIFESYPGHFVSGSLFRSKSAQGKRPVVLNPHGHWPNGRFYDNGEDGVRKEIASGAERFEDSGQCPLQARCVQLARMGCLVFHYDMVGYADSIQVPHHPHAEEYAKGTIPTEGFATPAAELRLQNVMGLQTWNSIRALDFVLSLPDADPTKVAVTGASGGGTQSFILAAADDRVTAQIPAVMVSTAMQGGCTCENAPYLRIGAGNIDLAAIPAPRPLGLIAADDWTKEVATKGYPDLQKLYAMLGQPDRLGLGAYIHFGHNYNAVSRMFMYNFVNKHFALGQKEPVIERDFHALSKEELTVWTANHPAPTGDKVGAAHEKALLKWLSEDSDKQVASLADKAEFRRVVGGAWETIIGRNLDEVGPIAYDKPYQKLDRGDHTLMTAPLTVTQHKEQVPTLFLHPKENWNKQVVIWLTEEGKSGLLGADGKPVPQIAELLKKGYAVAGLDLLGQGEATADGKPWDKARIYTKESRPNDWYWQHPGMYMWGYNRPLFAQRVHDVLAMVQFARTNDHGAEKVHLVAFGRQVGPVALAARAQSGDAIGKAAVDTAGFDFATLTSFDDPMFVPGAVKYGGVKALVALNDTDGLWTKGGSKDEAVKWITD